jgi:hypothetical protein
MHKLFDSINFLLKLKSENPGADEDIQQVLTLGRPAVSMSAMASPFVFQKPALARSQTRFYPFQPFKLMMLSAIIVDFA